MPNALQSSSERSALRTRAALSAAATAVRRLRFGSSNARPTATISGRMATISVPESPNSSTAGVIRIGAEREAGVAADREEAHAGAAARARRVVGVARALRVEGGDAEAADPDGDGGEAEVRRHPREPDPDRRERDAEGHQPGEREAVRDRAERGLDDRGPDRDEQQQSADRGIRIAALGDQERDQGGNGALTEICDRVAGRESGQATAVEISEIALPPGLPLEATASPSRCARRGPD